MDMGCFHRQRRYRNFFELENENSCYHGVVNAGSRPAYRHAARRAAGRGYWGIYCQCHNHYCHWPYGHPRRHHEAHTCGCEFRHVCGHSIQLWRKGLHLCTARPRAGSGYDSVFHPVSAYFAPLLCGGGYGCGHGHCCGQRHDAL